MFDIGFWEITVIAVVALLVVGPNDFPALVRTIGSWMGRMRSFVNDFRQELDQEVSKAEELKRRVERESEIAKLHEVLDESKQTVPVEPPRRAPRPKAGRDGGQRGDQEGGDQGGVNEPARGPEDPETGGGRTPDASGRDPDGRAS